MKLDDRYRSRSPLILSGSVMTRSRTRNARFVASTIPWICSKLSACATRSRSNSARIMREARPCVGGGDFATDVTAIEILKAGMGQMFEGCGKFRLFETRADLGHLAIKHKR